MLFKLSFLKLQNVQDAEDVVQEVFYQYVKRQDNFEGDEHEKAWLIRVAINACKDLRRSFFRSRTLSLDEIAEPAVAMPPDHREVLEAVLSLPQKYKEVIYLHYYEEYTAPQIGKLLHKNTNTVYSLLARGRTLLKEKLGDADYE